MQPAMAQQTIKPGLTTALTGLFNEFGDGLRRGASITVDARIKKGGINGRQIEMLEADGQPRCNAVAQAATIACPKGASQPPRKNVFSVAIANESTLCARRSTSATGAFRSWENVHGWPPACSVATSN